VYGQTENDEAELDKILNLTDYPYNIDSAKRLLLETNQVMRSYGVRFFLRQGTCLGAVRDGGLLPWDDDIDIGSIYGFYGFSEESIEPIIQEMRNRDFLVRITIDNDYYKCVTFVKESMRIDWACYWIINDCIYMYPAVPIPISLFVNLTEISLLGETFLVPDPPEEYLQLKYGEDWKTPKRAGEYEADVLDLIHDNISSERSILKKISGVFSRSSNTKIYLMDRDDKPLIGARLFIAGIGNFKSNRNGEVSFNLPGYDYYALRIDPDGTQYILYSEKLHPDNTYNYRPGDEHLTLVSDKKRE